MRPLRLHDKGPDVKILQQALARAGLIVEVSGHFGHGTMNAVKLFQRANFLLPDAIVGLKTMQALGVQPATQKEPARLIDPVRVSSPGSLAKQIGECLCSPAMVTKASKFSGPIWLAHVPSTMSISKEGKDFIARIEDKHAQFYWPGGNSGVTIGIGFDFKERNHHEIENIFNRILPPNEHSKISTIVKATKLNGPSARAWADANQDLLDLDDDQIRKLLDYALQSKESAVKHGIHEALFQNQFDALVSFAYNPGGKWHHVCNSINHGKVTEAMKTIGSAVISRGVMAGLANRRQKEISLYLWADYGN